MGFLFAHGPHRGLWWALAASAAAGALAFCCLRQRWASRSAAGLYVLGLLVITLGQFQRGYAPAKFFVWGGLCDWAGFQLYVR